MTESILVPMDGSPLSEEAFRYALDQFPEASITVLHVVDLSQPGYGVETDYETSYEPLMGSEEWYERAEAAAERLFSEARDVAAEYDREINTESEIGDPKRIIVDYAAEEDVDGIVIGAHGRADPDRSLFGSIAELVARRATVPVTLVR